ncbi:argininosuccinate lyase [Candidatus Vidania fulgoroideae]|uniref:Argininosuccinate lyase n=1 Tax=Candidatus Vidania fulgoroideorum TaxID=881286 RepID=A0A975AE90_9PROT|nr:argininosuccinate lyase [Candidatus Vidania fulgoroideae]
MKEWSGRFSKRLSSLFIKYTMSIRIDRRLSLIDVICNIAHCNMLRKIGVLKKRERYDIVKILKRIFKEIKRKKLNWMERFEDIHTNIERHVIERNKKLGLKMRTARSRNDLSTTELRIWIKNKTKNIFKNLKLLIRTIINISIKSRDIIMPSFTHFQIAQPIILSHYWLCYKNMFYRDLIRFRNSYKFADYLPLGSGAVSGTSFNIDRKYLARKLKFKNISNNSIDSVSDRDYVMDFCFSCSMCILHISRICEEIIIFTNSLIDFISIDDRYCSGSSMMPQKKNPDVFEVMRSKAGTVISGMISLMIIMKGLPLAYNKDYQEDKQICFKVADNLCKSLRMLNVTIRSLKFKKKKLMKASEKDFSEATDLAEYLTKKGVPYMKSHEIVSRLVNMFEEKGSFKKLRDRDIRKVTKNKHVLKFVRKNNIYSIINKKISIGGTSIIQINREIKNSIKKLKKINI